MQSKLEEAMKRADTLHKKQLQADADEIAKDASGS
jgi:hypothetical protein